MYTVRKSIPPSKKALPKHMRQGDFPYFFFTKNRRGLSSRQFRDAFYENLAGVSAPRLKVVAKIIRFQMKIHKHRYVKKENFALESRQSERIPPAASVSRQ
ncbi:MAG: hypothetical protein IIX93_00930 [Clostridia bacterium]|nr:hypothetical protein [Clostridia bacterium]